MLAMATPTFAQDFSDLTPDNLKTQEDLKKNEGRILDCAKFVLGNPVDGQNKVRTDALRAIILWMSNTSAYTFEIDGSISSLMKKNDDIMGLYMAALTQFALENPNKAKDKKEVKLNSFRLMLEYCNKPTNNV
jgi:hypothetical protein